MLLSLLAGLAVAAPASGDEPWTLTPEVGTEVPLAVDVGLRLETPYRLRLRLGVGVLPGPYVALANDVALALFPEGYDEQTAILVESALTDALLLRARASWRPARKAGFTFGSGVTYASLGGSATAAELLEGLLGVEVPDQDGGSTLDVDATAQVLLVDGALGWEIRPFKEDHPLRGLQIRPTLGWAFSVRARSELEPDFEVRPRAQPALDRLVDEGETYLDEVITAYVHPPLIGIQVGWRFPVGE